MRLVILFSAFLTTACATQQSRNLDTLLRGYETEGFSGVVLVAKNDRVVLHEGYGFADKERRIRNTTSTRFEIASLTKTFTAAAILRLEAGGALRTSDLLSQHLGEFPPEKATATIHHLATHTAGLVPDGTDLGEGIDREQFIAAVKSVVRESAPGERYRYTNAGYSLLAAVIEKASGQSYESYVRQHFFPRAAFRGDDEPRLAKGYGADGKLSTPPPLRWATRGAGGMIASVEEVYDWHRALHGGRALDATQLAKMFHDWPEEEGYAWHVTRDAKGRRFIHKGGGMREYASQILYYPDERLVIIWASNDLQTRWRQTLNAGLQKAMLGE